MSNEFVPAMSFTFEADGSKKPIRWSQQQLAFLNWCKNSAGSCILEAGAGTGKTTTIIGSVQELRGQVAILAYNKKIADEIKAKLLAAGIDWKKAQGGTVHSFGFSALRKAFPGIRTVEEKVSEIMERGIPDDHEDAAKRPIIEQLVSLAKQRAIGVMGRIDDIGLWHDIIEHFGLLQNGDDSEPARLKLIRYAQAALQASNADTKTCDFDDMVYLPLVHRCRFWQFDNVIIDEAQDTNAARRALVRALVRKGGRVIAVGDRFQAIYGFTGADSDSLDLIAKDFNCIRMPLSVTFRCPKAVVEFSHQWVTFLQAHETAPQGTVSECSNQEFLLKKDELNGNAAVLCRNTKPLVSLAFQLIRSKIPCKVEGREIGNSLKKLATRWKLTSIDDLDEKLEDYLAQEKTKLLAKKREAQLQIVEDTVETLRVIMDQCKLEQRHTVADISNYIDDLFVNNVTGMLVLSTIHKSKGREWQKVFWLDRLNTCPSKWARQEWQQEQENNLCYVAATRAKSELIELAPQNERRE